LERTLGTGVPAARGAAAKAESDSASRLVATAGADADANHNEPTQAVAEESRTESMSTDSLIEQIKSALEQKKRRLLIAAIEAARRLELEGDELLVEFNPDAKHFRDALAKADSAKLMREICSELCGREIGIRFAVPTVDGLATEPRSPEEEQRQAKQKARQAAAQNPMVQQALSAFGGEIVDVKPL
jgi:hypothetical protein